MGYWRSAEPFRWGVGAAATQHDSLNALLARVCAVSCRWAIGKVLNSFDELMMLLPSNNPDALMAIECTRVFLDVFFFRVLNNSDGVSTQSLLSIESRCAMYVLPISRAHIFSMIYWLSAEQP